MLQKVLNSEYTVIVGGDRELNCDSCRTKPQRRVLEGYFEENFDFKLTSHMVREKCILQLRLMDLRTPPTPNKGIGFWQGSLHDLASRGGEKETITCNLLALGQVINSYGNIFEHGTELRGYRDPLAPVTLEFSVEMPAPGQLVPSDIVPREQQLSPWKFHLLSKQEQEAYDARITGPSRMLTYADVC
jgi:hypothetical protein